jgi:hypothetical protein
MRLFALIAAITLLCPPAAQGRLFWQTYGATVAAPGEYGHGCAWNMNQDYFVPRHCDSGRYDLFSPCKKSHYLSPACKNLHPIYSGYCTPYGACRYKWRDHVYKTYCGCTPWSHTYGPWRLGKCCKPLPSMGGDCGCQGACSADSAPCDAGYLGGHEAHQPQWLCNVEPMGGETLGSISALTVGIAGAGGMSAAAPMPGGMAPSGAAANTAPALPPKLNLTPTAGAGGGLPAPFNY